MSIQGICQKHWLLNRVFIGDNQNMNQLIINYQIPIVSDNMLTSSKNYMFWFIGQLVRSFWLLSNINIKSGCIFNSSITQSKTRQHFIHRYILRHLVSLLTICDKHQIGHALLQVCQPFFVPHMYFCHQI